MQLIIIRHAIAEDRAEFARTRRDDDQRPLTPEGRRKMKQGAEGLREAVPKLDLLGTSPLVRAVQTAEIVAAAYRGRTPVEVPALAPDQPSEAIAAWLRTVASAETVAVVGHEPGLGLLVGWFIAGAERPVVELKKGAACLLDLGDSASSGQARLLWALTPGQLRRLGA